MSVLTNSAPAPGVASDGERSPERFYFGWRYPRCLSFLQTANVGTGANVNTIWNGVQEFFKFAARNPRSAGFLRFPTQRGWKFRGSGFLPKLKMHDSIARFANLSTRFLREIVRVDCAALAALIVYFLLCLIRKLIAIESARSRRSLLM